MKISALLFLALLFLFKISFGSSNESTLKDSLLTKLLTVPEDTTKVGLFHDLMMDSRSSGKLQDALEYAHKALELSERLNHKPLKATSNGYIGTVNLFLSSYDSAIFYYKQGAKYYLELQDKKGLGASYNNIGNSYLYKSEYPLALKYLFKSVELNQEIDEKKAISSAYNNIAIIFEYQGDYSSALEYNFKSIKIKEKLEDHKGIAASYINIGNLYYMQKESDKALNYYLKTIPIREQLKDKKGLSSTYNNIATILKDNRDYLKALDKFNESAELKMQVQDKRGLAGSWNNIADIFVLMAGSSGDSISLYKQELKVISNKSFSVFLLDSAMFLNLKALEVQKDVNDLHFMINSLNGIANILSAKATHEKNQIKRENLLKEATSYFLEAVSIADEISSKDKYRTSANNLYECYKKLKNHEQALHWFEISESLKDSLFSSDKQKDIGKLEAEYGFQKQLIEKQKEQEKKDALSEVTLKREKFFSYSASGGGILLLLILGLVLKNFRQKKKAHLILEEKNKIIQDKNKDITDSINYAKQIQSAILPEQNQLKALFNDYFLFYEPRDIVSGDFYWCAKKDEKIFVAVADCTGHGVPGAFMSMIGSSALNHLVLEKHIQQPDLILKNMHIEVRKALRQSINSNRDGMDVAIITFDTIKNQLEFSGAMTGIHICYSGELNSIKGDRHPIGGDQTEEERNFSLHTIELKKSMTIFLTTDGYTDQFGG
ncbi:MAG: tetratricopeptide repeat protein, partial [Bacteroidota bacterium]|nr:tetratricopeptide repeat protein [Bacteroidota bacterium]